MSSQVSQSEKWNTGVSSVAAIAAAVCEKVREESVEEYWPPPFALNGCAERRLSP